MFSGDLDAEEPQVQMKILSTQDVEETLFIKGTPETNVLLNYLELISKNDQYCMNLGDMSVYKM